MKVLNFDKTNGIFHLEIKNLSVDRHSHPAIEIMKTTKGSFSLETDSGKYNNLTFAIIDANIKHKIVADQNEIVLLMLESNNTILKEFLYKRGIETKNGVFTSTKLNSSDKLIKDLIDFSTNRKPKFTSDKRIYDCIEIIETADLPYNILITALTSKLLLSESRVSHLFTENVGISIKKYQVWNKLKLALDFFLNENTSLKEASFAADFFDQPHFNKAFRNYLGINPSEVFNSRTIQL